MTTRSKISLLSMVFLLLMVLTTDRENRKVMAQQIFCKGGDYFSNNLGSLCQSIGEIATDTYTNGATTLTQGLQQPLGASISGLVTYYNSANTPLSPVKIFLTPNGLTIDSASKKALGQYKCLYISLIN